MQKSPPRLVVSGGARVSGGTTSGGLLMHNNYIHIATMTVAEMCAYAIARGLMPSDLLDGRSWLRRLPSEREG